MIKSDKALQEIIRDSVLTTEEACDILGRTRQQLHNLINKGLIVPFKKTSNINLYWASDVYALQRKLNNFPDTEYHEIHGFTTAISLSKLRNANIDSRNIAEIYVFSNGKDAVLKGFYNVMGVEIPNMLTHIETPSFVIVMNDGKTHWFRGLMCGDECEGTKTALKELGVMEMSDLDSTIPFYSELLFYKENGEWKYHGVKPEENSNIEHTPYYAFYNKTFVMMQELSQRKLSDISVVGMDIVKSALFFVPNPISIKIISEEEAIKGRFCLNDREVIAYRIIIKDITEREYWLPYFSGIEGKKPFNMKEFFKVCGIEVKEESMTERLNTFLEARPRMVFN